MSENKHIILSITKKIDKVFDFLSKASAVFSGVLLLGVTIIICAGVFNRALTDWVWLFVEEWSGLALIPISYLVFGYTLRKNRHLRMDLIVRRLTKKWQKILAIFSAAFSLVCLGFMIRSSANWFIYTLTRNVLSSGPMKTPLWLFSASILFSVILFAIDMILFMANAFIAVKYGKSQLRFDETDSSEFI